MDNVWPWLSLALLGAYHGLNPGMGWLFAVALGLQERRRAAVAQAFTPIVLGHALSVAGVVALVGVAQTVFTPASLRAVGALALVVFGAYKLVRAAHPRWVGMRVNFRDLTVWSFLMATAHGAGLMLLPILLKLPAATAEAVDHSAHSHAEHIMAVASTSLPLAELAAVGLHTAAMFITMAAIAFFVYEKLGVSILRRAWFNLDRIWAVALIAVGTLTFVI
jgi:hypothetical protein